MNQVAPPGQVYICTVCAKRSKDKYGDKPIDYGWDTSCVMNSVLMDEDEAATARYRYQQASDEL